MSFPGLELQTDSSTRSLSPQNTETWHFSSHWKGLRREVDGAHAKDTAGIGVGRSYRARIPKPQGFAIRSLMLDS